MRRGARSRISESGEIGKVVDYTECFFFVCLRMFGLFVYYTTLVIEMAECVCGLSGHKAMMP